LYQVFQLGLQGLSCHVIDAWPRAGGQPVALYPDKPIYDLPALPACGGRELTERLLTQLKPFAPTWHLGHTVQTLTPLPDGCWCISTDQGLTLNAKVVVIAAGVGAFQPRGLTAPGASALHHAGVLCYHPPLPEVDVACVPPSSPPPSWAGRHVLVIGGEQDAVDDACTLADWPSLQHRPACVTLLHRRATLSASAQSLARLNALQATGALRFVVGQVLDATRPAGVTIEPPEGDRFDLPVDEWRVFLGLSPKLGPISQWDLVMRRKQLEVNPSTMGTSATGVFAVGDINTYPGKKKLLVCGFHEAVMAAFAIAALIYPQRPAVLEYTSSSSRLQALLGLI
jgi:thioredoxin reductase (NADPH)